MEQSKIIDTLETYHLTYFALEGGVSGRSSLKIEGKGNSEMTLLSAYITLKMQLLTPVSHLTLK